MGKQKDKIAYLMILLFVIFAIFYIYMIITLIPLIYLIITTVVVIIILTVGSYVLYKNKNQILPFVIVRFFWNFIKIVSSGKISVKGEKVSPPLTEYEKKGIIYELAKGKCEHLDCNIQEDLNLYHIIPRSEGGRNTYNNLIVLCPNHYAMADRGVLSKGLLRYFINIRDK